nr:hypothetical protein [Tanacetum cinerariifolium]
MFCQFIQKKQEEKQIEEVQAAKAQNSKIPVCYDDDDDYNSAITSNEPVDSFSMGDEHLNTISVTESDEFIKSCVENLVPNLSESEGESECDEPCHENCGDPHENFQCQSVNYCEPNPSYDSYYSSFDQFGDFHPQQYPCCENCGGPHETFQCQPPKYTVNHPIFNSHNDFLNSQNELFTSQNTIMEQMTQLTSMCELVCQIVQKKQEEKRIKEEQAGSARYWKIPACCDDDDDYDYAITPEEIDNSLSMEDEHLDTIQATESDEVIKSSVEDLVPIPSESEGIPDTIYDDSLYKENIEYVEASPHDSELVSLEAAEIVIPKEEEIKDDNLREKFLNVHLLIANIEALKDNPTQSSELLTKSSSTSLNSLLVETNTFHNSLPEFENFYFDLGEISSGSTTTHSDISLSEYDSFIFDFDNEEFVDELAHIISPPDTTTHSDISLLEYDLFIFDLSNDQSPPTDRSDFTREEFDDELAHIISPLEYDCFYFRNLPDPGEWISNLNSRIHENLSSTTRMNLPVEDDRSPLLAYFVWIFLAYLTYPVILPYLHSFGNEDTIFDPGIAINRFYSFKPGLSHRCGTFKKFNTHRSHLNESPKEMLFSTCFPMDQ